MLTKGSWEALCSLLIALGLQASDSNVTQFPLLPLLETIAAFLPGFLTSNGGRVAKQRAGVFNAYVKWGFPASSPLAGGFMIWRKVRGVSGGGILLLIAFLLVLQHFTL